MKKLLALAAVASVTVIAAPAFAEMSGSVGFSQASIGDVDVHAVTSHAKWADGHFGVEVEAAWSSGDAKVGTGASQTSVQLRSEAGLFGVVQTEVADKFTVFGRVGLANVHVQERGTKASATHIQDTGGGAAYGVGAEWYFSGPNGVRADYTVYDAHLGRNSPIVGSSASFSDENADIWTLSFVHKFGGAAKPAEEKK